MQGLANPKLRSFHIQFLHRAYHLNAVRAYYTDCSAMCTFCKTSAETHAHFYWDCVFTQSCWQQLIEFCEECICTDDEVMSKDKCLLSNFSSKLLVLVTVLFKKYLFLCRFEKVTPSFVSFLMLLKKVRDNDFKRCKYCKKLEQYYKFWNVLNCDEVFRV